MSDIETYAKLMKEIKARMAVVEFFLSGKGHALYEPPTLECVGLQIRKILELIAFGSLAANKDIYSAIYAKFSKEWHAGELLQNIKKVNSDFYPVPVIEEPSPQPGVKSHLREMTDGFLSQQEFVEVYGRCGSLMHSANPYGTRIDYAYFKSELPKWQAKIIQLLHSHQVHLLNHPGFYLIHMKEPGHDEVSYYEFRPRD
jgi:hypothetical protein